jgi:hypothetical protein
VPQFLLVMEIVSQALEGCKLGKIEEVEIGPSFHSIIEAVSRFEQREKRVLVGCGAMCMVQSKEPLCRQADTHNAIFVGYAHLFGFLARVHSSREDSFADAARALRT